MSKLIGHLFHIIFKYLQGVIIPAQNYQLLI